MIIGLISDTHGLLRGKVKEELSDCELIIHAGDIGKNDIISILENICKVEYVYGNIDKNNDLKLLHKIINVGKIKIYITHNIKDINIDIEKENIDIVVYGHSHKSEVYEKNGVLYINPGSVGPRRFKLMPKMAKLYINEITDKEIYKFKNYMVEFIDIDTQP